MKVYAIALAAGIPFRTERFGRYFRLVSTSAPLVVNLYKRNAIVYDADQVEGGFWAMPDDGFDAFELVSAGVQTVYVGVSLGNAGYDRSQGSVQITGPLNGGWLGVSLTNISSTYADNFAGRYSALREMVFVEDLGIPAGASNYKSTTTLAANTPENIWSAAANANGAILWAAGSFDVFTAGGNATFLAKATTPTGIVDGDLLASSYYTVSGANNILRTNLAKTTRIAAGKRADFIVNGTHSGALRGATYSLL